MRRLRRAQDLRSRSIISRSKSTRDDLSEEAPKWLGHLLRRLEEVFWFSH